MIGGAFKCRSIYAKTFDLYDRIEMEFIKMSGWIGVDFDGTLAKYEDWNGGELGDPIWPMVNQVKLWLSQGKEVRIFTARVGRGEGVSPESGRAADDAFVEEQRRLVGDWTEKHIGQRLRVTAEKDFGMIALFDDRAVRVHLNEGTLCLHC
jgi:hypothetical protein